ncbi:probable G-protein coupled receptor Mth-like 8 [Drosophila grimshawi]|uniref:GH15473 n=1 Tax=Drosophila grimshawi TaxID=7222 RepID=B4J2B8_DROGR|nr:probable G-protein coupled receptor Mth-like 8 [Drosophila grimshawi]EDV95977.1 GH15473 [Drosophila grimshawi]
MSSATAQLWLIGCLLIVNQCCTSGYQEEGRHPCAFIDTVNITGSYRMDGSLNNSYVHNWTVIPKEFVTDYDFVIENGIRVPTERHLRACICKQRPCVRFCCPNGQLYDLQDHKCVPHSAEHPQPPGHSHMTVGLRNGTQLQMEIASRFSVHVETPCDNMRAVIKDGDYFNWTLYEDGSIIHREHLFTKHYCYTLVLLGNRTWSWQPLACAPEKIHFVLGVREWTYAICLLICIISMFIVLIVHLACSQMRNSFYGVAVKAYTTCVIIGYALLAHLTLHNPANLSTAGCRIIPSFALLFLVLSFYILSFISFKLYLSFHGVVLTKLMFWMILGPIVLIAIGWSFFVGFSYHGAKLVFGGDTCWFDPRTWTVMIYFFAPIFIACAISSFFYILTLIKIDDEHDHDSEKSFESLEKNRLSSFWKFFTYTALTYLVCVCSFAFNYWRKEKSHLNYAVCFCTAFHGFAALYALIGKNQQIQLFLLRINENNDEDTCENSVPMTIY